LKTRIKEFRTKTGLTQQQLATAVHVSTRSVISLEKGQYNPSLLLAYRIAVLFNTTVEELCCLKENKELEDKKYEKI
jgi:putative transcriptional regulator